MENTLNQFNKVVEVCKNLFSLKLKDYSTAWRILRISSLTDQIYIKASRIRTIQEKKENKINEGQEDEFIGIINYSIVAIIQLRNGIVQQPDMTNEEALIWYNKIVDEARSLMMNKNHDYGEAWRDMRVSSITDLILQKLLRVKQIENNEGFTNISEGLEANYLDMINYAIFALILLEK